MTGSPDDGPTKYVTISKHANNENAVAQIIDLTGLEYAVSKKNSWGPWIQIATKSDLQWKFLNYYNLTTNVEQDITIPTGINELLIVAGFPNPESTAQTQIYGGKTYIMPSTDYSRNIIYEHEFYDASGNGPRCGGFYAFWSSAGTGNILKIKADNPPVRARVYYR